MFWGNWLLAFNGYEGGLGFFFLESGDRGEGGLQLHITLTTPAYFSFTVALDVRWDAWTEMAQCWILFLFAMSCCKIATMRKRMAFRGRYDICFSGIEA